MEQHDDTDQPEPNRAPGQLPGHLARLDEIRHAGQGGEDRIHQQDDVSGWHGKFRPQRDGDGDGRDGLCWASFVPE